MSDEPRERDPGAEEEPGAEDAEEASQPPAPPSEGPAPATWAGRARAGGGEQAEPPAAEPAEDGEPVAEQEPETEPADEPPDEAGGGEPEEAEAPDEAEAEQPEEAEAEQLGPEPGTTIEADTPALADAEQARERAHAGLRERAAREAARRETAAQAAEHAQPAAAEPEVEAEEEDEEEDASATEPEESAVAVAAAAPGAEQEGAPKPKALWARFLAASLVIVVSMAAATSVSILLYLTDIARGLSDNGALGKLGDQLAGVEGGDPQTILILGSDERLDLKGDPGRSDTTILLRVDPEKEAIALLSIPRDLKVDIPGVFGPDKFNAAYSYGGPKLTLRVVKQLTGLDVNHVVNINFTGFADAVDAIDCVYIDVDRRYFVPEESEYSAIDPPIEPGYQRLCGLKALQYVRFRLDDNDLVRSARQQDFMREARQKVPPIKVLRDSGYRNELVDIFTDYTTSDIDDPVTMLELLKTFFNARGATVHEVHFPADLGDGTSGYVTASNQAIKEAAQQFLGVTGTPGPQPAGSEEPPQPEQAEEKPEKPKEPKPEPEPEPEDGGPEMLDVTAVAQQLAQRIDATKRKDGDPMLDFPVMYPTRLVPGSTLDPGGISRAFVIDGPEKDVYHGYKFAVSFPGQAGFSEYYGISGTDWEEPPILENPSETREIDGREYMLFYDGDRLRLVGFKTKKGSYWVINSLLQTLDEDQMISIATSMRELGG